MFDYNLPAVAFLEGWRPELVELNTAPGLTLSPFDNKRSLRNISIMPRATTPGQLIRRRSKFVWKSDGKTQTDSLFIFPYFKILRC